MQISRENCLIHFIFRQESGLKNGIIEFKEGKKQDKVKVSRISYRSIVTVCYHDNRNKKITKTSSEYGVM